MYVVIQAVLFLYVSGHTNCILLDSRDSPPTLCRSAYHSYAFSCVIMHLDKTDWDLIDYIMTFQTGHNYSITNTAKQEILHNIKEKLCYVTLDFEQEMATAASIFLLGEL